jgi:hypothetical protein
MTNSLHTRADFYHELNRVEDKLEAVQKANHTLTVALNERNRELAELNKSYIKVTNAYRAECVDNQRLRTELGYT